MFIPLYDHGQVPQVLRIGHLQSKVSNYSSCLSRLFLPTRLGAVAVVAARGVGTDLQQLPPRRSSVSLSSRRRAQMVLRVGPFPCLASACASWRSNFSTENGLAVRQVFISLAIWKCILVHWVVAKRAVSEMLRLQHTLDTKDPRKQTMSWLLCQRPAHLDPYFAQHVWEDHDFALQHLQLRGPAGSQQGVDHILELSLPQQGYETRRSQHRGVSSNRREGGFGLEPRIITPGTAPR